MENLFRIDGLVYRVMLKIWQLLLLNFLILMASLPLITIGAAQTAGFAVTTHMITKGETQILATFVTSFKKNFKQSTLLWGILLLSSSILIINWNYLIQFQQWGSWVTIGLGIVTLLVLNLFQYAFFYIARFDDSFKSTIRNLLKLPIRYPVRSMLLMIAGGLPLGVMTLSPYTFVFGLYMSCFLGISLVHFFRSYLLLSFFEKVVERGGEKDK